jgi:hypothetical protein
MGTIDQPKPSQPKSPTGDAQPLQPGGTGESRTNASPEPERPNPQPPDTEKR